MIILNLNKINTFLENFPQILKKYAKMLNFGILECPHCHSNNIIRWGFYFRNIFYIDNDIMHFDSLKVQRVKCNDCNHTHALLPSYIVPYKQPVLDVILESIKGSDYSYEFSYETILNWKKTFNKSIPYFTNIIKITKNIIFDILNDIFNIYDKFYFVNNKIFMMSHKGIFNMAYLNRPPT